MDQNSYSNRPTDRHRDLKFLSEKLDSQFKLPFGIKIGWDGIIGLIPGVGDLLTTSFSFYILVRAAALGCPPSLIFRMGINILIESIVDVIPLVGNLFDFFWKSNLKNVRLIEQYVERPQKTTWASRAIVFAFILAFAAVIVGFFVLAVKVLSQVWDMLQQNNWTA